MSINNAAIYARKSTDQSGVADDQKSVARQVEHARQYAARKGWTVTNEHIFSDEAVSGAEFERRPGFVRLLNALKPRAQFSVLIVAELSRIGREQLETGYAVKQLAQANVKIVSYLEDREVLLESATDKFLMNAVNFAAEIEREKARQRTYDAMSRKARAGHVTGGRTFGYDNRDVAGPNGTRSHVIQEINRQEAAIVRRIFDMATGGAGSEDDCQAAERRRRAIATRAAGTFTLVGSVVRSGSALPRDVSRPARLEQNA